MRSHSKVLSAALVDKVKVDVGNMKGGDTIRVKDLEIAKDKRLICQPIRKQLWQR